MGEYVLITSGLCKYYGKNSILENVSISVPSKIRIFLGVFPDCPRKNLKNCPL